jgi:adenylyltransferase/sulfurtransferase
MPASLNSVESDVLEFLSREEVRRYSRHLLLPQVGVEGQRRLREAKVVIVGMGGLGSPIGLYLAAAGVGRIGLVDYDRVDESNLQRQILYGMRDLGVPKPEAAKARLEELNPLVQVDLHPTQLTSKNAEAILAPYDVVVDGTDNFPARYLLSDATVLLQKPYVYGSIYQFDGYVSVFDGSKGPCYRCLFPVPPPPGEVPSCAAAGVLGVLPGVIGTLQATETLKILLGKGDPLVGRMLLFDAMAMTFDMIQIAKKPNCPVCGEKPVIKDLIDYEDFCGFAMAPNVDEAVQIGIQDAQIRIQQGDVVLLDVREPREQLLSNIKGSMNIPEREVLRRLDELKPSDEIIVYCRTGVRSQRVVHELQKKGYTKVRNLRGGINQWAKDIDPKLIVY